MRGIIVTLFIILLIAAAIFSFERILFLDASYILFRIINLDELQIQVHRYGSFITQVVPMYAARLGLPLNWIVILYSASFNLFYLIVAAILLYKYKNLPLAILMSFYYLLFASDTWFWTNNEVHQGIAWMFLFFGTVNYLGRIGSHIVFRILAFASLCFLSVFTHPLVMFPTLFLWIFFILKKEYTTLSRVELILQGIILISICLTKFYLSASGESYDSEKLHATTHISIKRLVEVFSSPLIKTLIKETIKNYWVVPVIFLVGVYYGIKKRQLLPVLLSAGVSFIYIVAICITFNGFEAFYTESELMPLSIIASTPFVYYYLTSIRIKKAALILIIIFSIRLTYISLAADKFIDRRVWIENTLLEMRKHNLSKAVIIEDSLISKKLLLNWGSPTESILASALADDNPQLTFVVATSEEVQPRMTEDPKQMISCFELWHFNDLDHRYFRIDTTSNYLIFNPRH